MVWVNCSRLSPMARSSSAPASSGRRAASWLGRPAGSVSRQTLSEAFCVVVPLPRSLSLS